jgi:hypothetical protein
MGVAMDLDEQRLGRRLKLRDLQVLLTVAKYGSIRNPAAPPDVNFTDFSRAGGK